MAKRAGADHERSDRPYRRRPPHPGLLLVAIVFVGFMGTWTVSMLRAAFAAPKPALLVLPLIAAAVGVGILAYVLRVVRRKAWVVSVRDDGDLQLHRAFDTLVVDPGRVVRVGKREIRPAEGIARDEAIFEFDDGTVVTGLRGRNFASVLTTVTKRNRSAHIVY